MKEALIKTENYLLVVDDSEINPLCWCLDTITNLTFQYYTNGEQYWEFVDMNMDNPWTRIIVFGEL